jgi:glycosyltransferase involved in cell wall biosynthesis
MKLQSVCFFIHSLSGGGAERATANLANYWAAKGWRVAIITLAPEGEDFYDVHPSVERIALDMAGGDGGIIVATWNNLRRILALRKALKTARPLFAIAMMTSANVVLAFASIGLSHRTIGCERIHPPHLPLGRAWEFLRRNCYGSLDIVAALTHQSADWIRRNTNARDVAIIPNAIVWPLPAQRPVLQPQEICSPGRFIILAVGRLVPQKQFQLLIEAFALFSATRSKWDLVILGDGPERSSLRALVKSLGLTERVSLPGEVGNIGDWYARAHIFALSSRFEGFPNALAEALAYGVPSVSFDCETGPRDILRHEETGLLVPPNNSDELVRALLRLIDEEGLRAAMARRAVEVRERLSLERIASRWEDLLVELQRSGQNRVRGNTFC